MPRKTIGSKKGEEKDESFDYGPLIYPGITMLKFGRTGKPHERHFKLSRDLRFLKYHSGWFNLKFGTKIIVDLEKVSQIMQGQNTFQFQRWSQLFADAQERSFTIVYRTEDNEERTLDLIAPSPEIFKLWYSGLNVLIKNIDEKKKKFSLDALYLKSLWERADADHSGTLTSKEVVQLISSININLATDTIRTMYAKFDIDKNGVLDFEEFVEFMTFLRKRNEIEAIWDLVVSSSPLPPSSEPLIIDNACKTKDANISLRQFIQFWQDSQGETLSLKDAWLLIETSNSPNSKALKADFQPSQADLDNYPITYTKFLNVLTNHSNSGLFDSKKTKEYQDMNLPLSYYYMASSHNTYLEGDQLTSFSSVKRYVNDLLLGCRCVELDCWDGDDGLPIIFHGHTLTGKILFKDVIKAIYEYGFVTSPYPIVLSIENHCCLDQQKIMAKMMVETFKDSLALPMKHTHGKQLPSPNELRHKILIKGKRLPPSNSTAAEEDDDEDDEEDDGDGTPHAHHSHKLEKQNSKKMTGGKSKKKAPKVHPDLSAITYLGTNKVKGFTKDISDAVPCDVMASYGETKVAKNLKSNEITNGWIYHNQNHLSRTYPKGSRIDSSNYLPVQAWASGSQLVALNYQTGDLPYHINFGKFLENGRTGYVLKPSYMLTGYHTDSELLIPQDPIRLTINVLSAASLPKPGGAQRGEVIDPFVSIFIHGPHDTDESPKAKTKTIMDNGFNPVWNQTFAFDILYPDISYITFHVNDEDVLSHEFIAFSSLPVAALKTGFRTVKLYNVHGKSEQDFEYTSLFVRVAIENISH